MYSEFRDYNQFLNLIHISRHCTAALLDIDHFVSKYKEESYSNVIQDMYHFFKKHFPYKTIYLGKDEFALISDDQLQSAETFIIELTNLNKHFEQVTNTTFSAAVGEYPSHAEDHIEFVRKLEESLHRSKQIARNRISLISDSKMKLKSNYYTLAQLERIAKLSKRLGRSEASLLREALDLVLRKYED